MYFCQNLTQDNFWVLYLIADIAFGCGSEVVLLFIERVIKYIKDDKWAPAISEILKKVIVDEEQLEELKE